MLPSWDRCHHGLVHKYRPLAIALIWVFTVAGASTLTWAVISSAGTQVGQTTIATAGTQTTGSELAPETPKPSGSASADSPATTGNATNKATNKATTKTSTSQPISITASWSGTGGKVTAKCTDNRISLVSAVPDLGYQVDRDDDGDAYKIKVEFEPTGKDGEDISLLITCQNQRPVFTREK
jgi:hypothetical protein